MRLGLASSMRTWLRASGGADWLHEATPDVCGAYAEILPSQLGGRAALRFCSSSQLRSSAWLIVFIIHPWSDWQ